MISSNDTILAEKDCDVPGTVESGSVNKVIVPLNNWKDLPVVVRKASRIGVLEEVINGLNSHQR